MTQIIGGHNLGLLFGSYSLLNRNDQTSRGTMGHGVTSYSNVSNGNLLLQERDVSLPSVGDDFDLIRTYNSRDNHPARWTWSFNVTMQKHDDDLLVTPTNPGPQPSGNLPSNKVTDFTVFYGDDSQVDFVWNAAKGYWISTDGAGAYETLKTNPPSTGPTGNGLAKDPQYIVTRADGSVYTFDKGFTLLSIRDTNGVTTSFTYKGNNVVTIQDDTGHTLTLVYNGDKLLTVSDSAISGPLVTYAWTGDKLTSVTDRGGHVTSYHYNNDGLIDSISMPTTQPGDSKIYDARTTTFQYTKVKWDDHPYWSNDFDNGDAWVLTRITDANGGITTFDYNFQFIDKVNSLNDRDLAFKPKGGRDFQGGTTRVLDAIGNARAYSNSDENVAWRTTHGYYVTYTVYDPQKQAAQFTAQETQIAAIRAAQPAVIYTYDANGQLINVKDELGFETSYTYNFRGDLTSITDANGWGAANLDTTYFQALRAKLGFKDSNGVGIVLSSLTPAAKATLQAAVLARFTTTFTYDENNGNLLTRTDNAGNVTTYTYNSFNRVASVMTANALNSTTTHPKTTYRYDLNNQNLLEKTDSLGNVTRYEYDPKGNLTRRIVFIDRSDPSFLDPTIAPDTTKQQITVYGYDLLGNNTSITDSYGHTTSYLYDPFGNVFQSTDARGSQTLYSFDADNRMLSMTDPEGHKTAFAYDSVGNRISVTTDPNTLNAHIVTSIYDRNNMLVQTIDPSATVATSALTRNTFYRYDIVGNGTSITDAEGRTTTYTYDAHRQLIDITSEKVKDGIDPSITNTYHQRLEYDGTSNVIRSTDRRNNVTEYTFTTNGLVETTKEANGNITEFLYDANLNRIQITIGMQFTEASGKRRVLKYGYDDEDQLKSETDAETSTGTTKNYTRDAVGNITAVEDAKHHTTNYVFDKNNRLLREIRPAVDVPDPQHPGQLMTVQYEIVHTYDESGNELSITDGRGNLTTMAYDADNRMVLVTDAVGVQTIYSYDSRDNRTSVAIGIDIAEVQLDSSKHVVLKATLPTALTTFVYDEFNQLVATTDGVGNALVTSDDAVYQRMRVALGKSGTVAPVAGVGGLSAADKDGLLEKYTEIYTYDHVGNRLTLKDHAGRVTRTEYDALNRIVSLTEALGADGVTSTALTRTTKYQYDGNDNLLRTSAPLAHNTTNTYDNMDRLLTTTDALGTATRFVYDNVGNVTTRTEAYTSAGGTEIARSYTYTYDLNNRLKSETDPLLQTTSYLYDAVGNRTRITDGRGQASGKYSEFQYDALDRNIKIIDPLNGQTTFEYDGADNKITIRDARGGITHLTYDAANRYVQTTDAEGRITRWTYDALGDKVTQTTGDTANDHSKSETTTYLYDAEGHLRQVTDAKLQISTSNFDQMYNLIETKDANGNKTTYGFDALNRQITITDPRNKTTTFTYDVADNILTQTDPISGHVKTWTYDVGDQKLTETDALGKVTTWEYDGFGNTVRITRGGTVSNGIVTRGARVTTFAYDDDDQLKTQTDANLNTRTYVYDANGNVTSMTNERGKTTTYEYDNKDQLTKIHESPDGGATIYTTEYKYDANGNRIQVIDARGNATTTYFNADNEAILTIDPTGFASADAYDANGNVVTHTDYKNRVTVPVDPTAPPPALSTLSSELKVTTYTYDALNRLVQTNDPLNHNSYSTYDAVGNKTSETDENGHKVSYWYDVADRLIAQVTAEGYLTTYGYDDAGNQTSINAYRLRYTINGNGDQPVPDGSDSVRTTAFTFDLNNRMLTKMDAAGTVTSFEYDAVGNLTAEVEGSNLDLAKQRRRESTYDLLDRVTDTKDAADNRTHFVLDEMGNVTARTEGWNPTFQTGLRTTRFTYDDLNRIDVQTDAIGVQTAELGHKTKFEYDAMGNLVRRTSGYDLGDPTKRRVERFEYDAAGRVFAQVNGAGDRTEFEYDASGNKITVKAGVVTGHNPVRTNRYEYDDDDRLSAEIDGNGVRTEYRYDFAGNAIEVIQDAGDTDTTAPRHTLMTYSLDDRLLTVISPLGWARANSNDALSTKWRMDHHYNATASMVSDTDKTAIMNMSRTQYAYDDLGNQTQITDADGVVTTNMYDVLGQLTDNVIAGSGAHHGIKIHNTYDEFGNVLSTTQSWGDDTDARLTTYTYDALDQQTSITDGEGNATVITYDIFGNQVAIQRGVHAGLTGELDTTLTYDAMDRLLTTRDGRGNIVQNTYDTLGNRITQTTGVADPDTTPGRHGLDTDQSSTLRFTYDLAGRVIQRDTPTGGQVKLYYDKAGNQTRQETLQSGSDASAIWTTVDYTYDGNGRVLTSTDSLHVRTDFHYDAFGNQTSVVSAALVNTSDTSYARTIRFEYDQDNNKVASYDAYDHKTSFDYDVVGNLVKQTDALGRVTRFYYDDFQRISGQLDARGYLTKFTRDSAGNITETRLSAANAGTVGDTDPMPTLSNNTHDKVISSAFDHANRITQLTSPDGSYKTYTYDTTDKVLTQTQHGIQDLLNTTYNSSAERTMRWTYDASGRMITFTNVDGTVESYTYDAANNKTSETLTNPNHYTNGHADDPVRTTTFTYDLDNRLTSQTFDPTSLGTGHINLQQRLAYDYEGNVITKTDARGVVTKLDYDKENRVSRLTTDPTTTDPSPGHAGLDLLIQYAYDPLGNLITATNPNGNIVRTTYDLNNRPVTIARPSVSVYTLAGGLAANPVTPTTTTAYDAVGNVVQITDARNKTTTRWYDEINNVIAEQNADGAVRRFTYDGFNQLTSVTQDMVFHTGSPTPTSSAPTLLGTALAGTIHTVTNTWDLGGHVTTTQYSGIDVTRVDYTTNASNPSVLGVDHNVVSQEQSIYDAFGNLVESVDRNGNHSFAYYDLRGRQIAAVNAAGFLTETDFDDMGNVIQQRKYKSALTIGNVSKGTKPTAPSGGNATVDRYYDIAGRLTDEVSPAVKTASDHTTRVTTHYAYDANGNLASKTLGYATSVDGAASSLNTTNPRTEYYYYDAANRRRAVVGADKVINLFDYDANGNLTRQVRYYLRLTTTDTTSLAYVANPATATLASIQAAAHATSGSDERTDYDYDSNDHLITRTDVLSGGNIINRSKYDEAGNLTYRQDGDSFITQTAYDGEGHVIETVAPNGSHSFIEYDTGGLKVRAWTGGATGSSAQAASSIHASITNGANSPLIVSYSFLNVTGYTSWVAFDTTSHDATGVPSGSPGAAGVYAHATSASGNSSPSVAVVLTPAILAISRTIYFRVMSRDSAGNLAWSEEKSVTIPPRIIAMSVAPISTGFRATIQFDGAVTSPTFVKVGGSSVSMSPGTHTNEYTADFTGDKSSTYHISWTANGTTYSTVDAHFLAAGGDHTDTGNGSVTWPLPTDENGVVGNGQYVFVGDVIQLDHAFMGSITTQGESAVNVTQTPAQRVNSGATLNFKPNTAVGTNSSISYDVYYGTLSGQTHNASITFSQVQTPSFTAGSTNKDGDGNVVSTNYTTHWTNGAPRATVSVDLNSLGLETGRVNTNSANGATGIHVTYKLSTDSTFASGNDAAATQSTNNFSRTITGLTAGSSYDIKVYYIDGTTHKEVIVEWRRVSVPTAHSVPGDSTAAVAGDHVPPTTAPSTVDMGGGQTYTNDLSLLVRAQETDGTIARGSGAALTVTPGTYAGPLDPGITTLTLTPADVTGHTTGGTLSTNGLTALTYYTQIVYNALGVKIGSNEDSGQWRTYGVDKDGNRVETLLWGTQAAAADAAHNPATLTFRQFNALDEETASWGADTTTGRKHTTRSYDYAGNVLTQTDDGSDQGSTLTYDEVGNVTQKTDAQGHDTTYVYNIFGQLLTTVANGRTRNRVYDSTGLLTDESTTDVTDYRHYIYDHFGRRTEVQVGTASDHTSHTMTYDQRDRVITVTDGLSHATTYTYDNRDNLTWVTDANGNFFGGKYDGMGQVTDRYAFTAKPSSLSTAQTLASAGTDSTLIHSTTTYDLFGNKTIETDAAGHHQYFTYGEFGRLTSTSTDQITGTGFGSIVYAALGVSTSALVTNFTYDRFGRKTSESSNYSKSIAYTYDNADQLTKIDDAGTHTSTDYTYDQWGRRTGETFKTGTTSTAGSGTTLHSYTYTYNDNGWMTGWTDSSTSIGEGITYDAGGNITQVVGKKSGNSSYFTHTYTYDKADRVTGSAGDTIDYDNRGRRSHWTPSGGSQVTYLYDDADRITSAAKSGGTTIHWVYDAAGNVLATYDSAPTFVIDPTTGNYSVTGGRAAGHNYNIYHYDANNNSIFSESNTTDHADGFSRTTTTYDMSGRVTSTQVLDGHDPGDQKTYTYTYVYNADGTEAAVSASGSGSVTGSSRSTYDVNRQLTGLNLGQPDGDAYNHAEAKTISYDNSGHIIRLQHDTGKSDASTNTDIKYLYANDNPAGEYSAADSPTLDAGNYMAIQNVPGAWGTNGAAPDFPASSPTQHVVQAGETLQSIASQVYGHPELWFLIADANGLTGSEQLVAGTRLTLPNSVQYVGNSNQDHTIYKEGDIIGSKLPNLNAPPPPPKDKCAIIAAIILIVVVAIIAVVVTVLTVGAAAPAAAAALGFTAGSVAGIIVGIAVGAVIGAAIAFTASVITQGILIGFKLQDSFNWKQVAADTVAGAFSGAAGGLGAMVEAAQAASVAIKVVNVVGQAALETVGEIARQEISEGHVDNWTSVAIAGGGAALGALASKGVRAEKEGEKVAAETLKLSELGELASKSKLLKTKGLEVGDTVFKNSKFKFKVVEDAESGGLIIKRFERLSALRKGTQLLDVTDSAVSRWQRFKSVFKQGLVNQTEGVRSLAKTLTQKNDEFIHGGTVVGSKIGNVKTVKAYKTVVDPVTGITRRVQIQKVVFRESYLGTSFLERVSQFSETWSSAKVNDKIKTVKTVEETTLASGEKLRTIKSTDVLRTSWKDKISIRATFLQSLKGEKDTVKKFENGTKVVKGYKEVIVNGEPRLEKAYRTVYRERFLKNGTGDRISEFFSSKTFTNAKYGDKKLVTQFADKVLDTGQVQRVLQVREVERLRFARTSYRAQIYDALASAATTVGNGASAAWDSISVAASKAYENLQTEKVVATVGNKTIQAYEKRNQLNFAYNHGFDGINAFFHNDQGTLNRLKRQYAERNQGQGYISAFRSFKRGGAGRTIGTIGTLSRVLITAGRAFVNIGLQSSEIGQNQNTRPYVGLSHPERDVGKDSFNDNTASQTFVGTHERQHSWVPTSWVNAAAGAATQIYSPFAIDKGADLFTTLSSNRLLAGQLSRFDARSIIGLIASTVGHVGTNPIPNPIMILDNTPVRPQG